MGGIFAPRPSSGPHKLAHCIPLTLIVRNRLHLARDMREADIVIHNKNISIDGKPRTDTGYPAGFMDVLTVNKVDKDYRLLYDTKGRFQLVPIDRKEAQFKLLKITNIRKQRKGIPVGHTHDGRNIRFISDGIKVNDTVKYDLKEGKIVDSLNFEIGAIAQITGGNSCGRIGRISQISDYEGSHTMIRLVDETKQEFITRSENVFVIGKDKPLITLPSEKGIRPTITQERERRIAEAEAKRNHE